MALGLNDKYDVKIYKPFGCSNAEELAEAILEAKEEERVKDVLCSFGITRIPHRILNKKEQALAAGYTIARYRIPRRQKALRAEIRKCITIEDMARFVVYGV